MDGRGAATTGAALVGIVGIIHGGRERHTGGTLVQSPGVGFLPLSFIEAVSPAQLLEAVLEV